MCKHFSEKLMAYHNIPLKKAKKHRKMPLPILSSSHLKNVEFKDGMGPGMDYGIFLCFFAFLRGGL